MSTLRLPPDEMALLRKVAAYIRGTEEPRWPTPDELRSFLTEHITVVKPGETLVLRLSHDLAPNQYRDIVMMLNDATDSGYIPFRVLCVPQTDELAVVQADGE